MAADLEVFLFENGDGDSLHRALCRALDIHPSHGSKSRVAEALGIRSQRYSRVIAKAVCALEPAARICSLAGVRMLVAGNTVHFYAPGEEVPAEGFEDVSY